MKNTLIIIVIIVAIAIAGYFAWRGMNSKKSPPNNIFQNTQTQQTQSDTQKWQGENLAIAGAYADNDVVEYEPNKFRMYYSEEPETSGFSGKVYSATSTDGKTWNQEDGMRKESATFPDVVKLPNNSFRMYFQNAGEIKSAKSEDGLNWADEAGVRIDKENSEGFELENVAAPTTILLNDGTYLMVYRGTINEPYGTEKLPNENTQFLFYATSKDGLVFEKQGIALDSRNSTLNGLTDGPDLIKWDGSTELTTSEIRLYFWSYKGIYHIDYNNGKFSTEPVFDYTNNTDSKVPFPQNPPGDPSVIKINNIWHLYYGQHTKGIYFTEYK